MKKQRYGLSGNKLNTKAEIITEYVVRALLIIFIVGVFLAANQCGTSVPFAKTN
tara:strand:+ start:775 stop:936 length:162 start_codon:yes stop_codon:yes gene_type:complete